MAVWTFSLLGVAVVIIACILFVRSGRADSDYSGRDEGDLGRRGGEGEYDNSGDGGDGGGD